MDVSVLGDPETPVNYSKHQVADAAGGSLEAAVHSGSEHLAMTMMTAGAVALVGQLHRASAFDGVILLG